MSSRGCLRGGSRRRWRRGRLEPAPPLEGDVEADVAIVGGGLHRPLDRARAAGAVPVARRRRARGRTSRLGAERAKRRLPARLLVVAPVAARVRRRRGRARRCARGSGDRARGSAPSARTCGCARPACSSSPRRPRRSARWRTALEAARALGVAEEAVPLAADEVARAVRSPRFRRGVLFRDGEDGAAWPPRAGAAAGGTRRRRRLHEGTRAVDVGPGWSSSRAGPRACEGDRRRHQRRDDRLAAVSRRLTNFGSYVVLTEPVPELLEEIGWTGGEAIVDGRMFIHYFRTTEDGRVLMGSGSGPIGFGGRLDGRFTSRLRRPSRRAEAGLRRLLPGLAGGAGRAGVGRADRRLGRPSAVLRDGARHADPLRGRLFRERGRARAGSAARSSPRSSPAPTTSGRAAARDAAGAAPPAGAVSAPRRRSRPGLDPRVRAGRGAGTAPASAGPAGRGAAAAARHADRHPLDRGYTRRVTSAAASAATSSSE